MRWQWNKRQSFSSSWCNPVQSSVVVHKSPSPPPPELNHLQQNPATTFFWCCLSTSNLLFDVLLCSCYYFDFVAMNLALLLPIAIMSTGAATSSLQNPTQLLFTRTLLYKKFWLLWVKIVLLFHFCFFIRNNNPGSYACNIMSVYFLHLYAIRNHKFLIMRQLQLLLFSSISLLLLPAMK